MSERLKPAPCWFCKDPLVQIETIEDSGGNTTAAYVICDECGAQGPRTILADDAIELWNTRHADEPQTVPETYRETVNKVAAAREKGYAAARANLQEAWSAMAMIRETVETLGPSGAVPAAEHLAGPTFMHEAEAIVNGIQALALSRPHQLPGE